MFQGDCYRRKTSFDDCDFEARLNSWNLGVNSVFPFLFQNVNHCNPCIQYVWYDFAYDILK